jgi:hypothetical protein
MKRRLRRLGPELLILLAGAVFALLGHGRWGNVTEDHGFWFSAAQSMVNGGRAMHEVRLQWGPMPLWILEAIGRLFGMHVASFVVFQFVVGLAAILGTQLFARRFLSPTERWISAAILVVLIVWMRGPGSLLYPCAFAMSQALLLMIATLFLCRSLLDRGRWVAASFAGLLAGITFQTKQEFGAAAALGIAALTAFAPGISPMKKLRSLILSGALFLAAYFGIFALTLHGDSFGRVAASNILWPWVKVPAPWAALYRKVLGLDDPGTRFVEAANSLVDVVAIGGTLWLLLYFIDLSRRRRAAAAIGILLAWVLWWWRWTEGSHFQPMTLVLPAILAAAILVVGRLRSHAGHLPPLPAGQGRREGTLSASSPAPPSASRPLPTGEANFPSAGSCFTLAAGALVLLQREGYRGNIEAYYSGMGYVLAVPASAIVIWWAIRGPRNAGRRSIVALAILLAGLGWFGLGRLQLLKHDWDETVAIASPRGTVYVARNFAPVLTSTYEFVRASTSPGDAILMMPQTYGMDFLLDRGSLLYFIWISPGYLPDEQELVARLEKTPPKAAVIFEGSFGIFHSGQFGKGFADRVVGWLETNLPCQEKFGEKTTLPGRRFLPASPGLSGFASPGGLSPRRSGFGHAGGRRRLAERAG